MRINSQTAISTSRVLLVPYEAHHVRKYHTWMQDPSIQEATASEPLTLDEEYENQVSWREAHDKLTFIACEPLTSEGPRVGDPVRDYGAREESMKGDINFFLYPDEDEEDGHDDNLAGGSENPPRPRQRLVVGEVDVMIADEAHRGRGFGGGAVRALLVYLRRNLDGILAEYSRGSDGSDGSDGEGRRAETGGVTAAAAPPPPRLRGLMAKIKEGNAGSRALFAGLGFVQRGEVNYFGEVTVVMGWEEAARRAAEWEGGEEYREVDLRGEVEK